MFKERKRVLFGLPLSFTTYELTEDRLFVRSGIFVRHEEEVRLYRITDLSTRVSLLQRMFDIGDIDVCSADATLGNFTIRNIRNVKERKEDLASAVESARLSNRVVNHEHKSIHEEECE